MRPCKSCKHRVHVACTAQVPYHVEVICKVCAPKPRRSPPPTKKQVKRRFNPQWKVGRPWLHFENGVMSCLACRAYPQMGLQKVWLDGTPQVCKHAVVAYGNLGVHAVATALLESGGASATVIGGFPPTGAPGYLWRVPYGLPTGKAVRVIYPASGRRGNHYPCGWTGGPCLPLTSGGM